MMIISTNSLVELVFSTASAALRSLRTLRVMRPLKSINSLPALRKHIVTLLVSVPSFLKVGLFVLYVYLILAIFGLHFYGTGYYNRCRYNQEPETSSIWKID